MSATGCIGEVLAHNTPGDIGQIVYDERGMIVREAFGRPLSKLETALCDALDKRNGNDIDPGFFAGLSRHDV